MRRISALISCACGSVVIFSNIKRNVAGSIPWKRQKVAVGCDEEIRSADVRMAESGFEKSVDPGKNILGFKNPTNGW
jgi:hypothetical protein